MTTGLEPGNARAASSVARPRGAHAAAKQGRIWRRSEPERGPAPAGSSASAPTGSSASAPGPADSVASADTMPIATQYSVPHGAASAMRSAVVGLAAALVVATVVPLALLQVPDAIAWAVPPRFASPGSADELLRAGSLALCAMTVAAPLGGLAVRRFRAWPVLIAGLGVFGLADVMGNTARTIAQVGIDRSLHGVGAGIALAASAALAAERPVRASRTLTGWWAVCVVAGLAAAPELMRHRLTGGDWHAALLPYPWLTGIALAVAALYAVAAEGAPAGGPGRLSTAAGGPGRFSTAAAGRGQLSTAAAATRNNFPPAERAQIALLTAPVAGMCTIAIAVTYGGTGAVIAAAIAESVALAGLGVMTGVSGSAAWFGVIGAVTGFAVAPAAGAATDLISVTPHTWLILAGAVGGGSACGVVLAAALPARHARLAIACGLSLAAVGFAIGYAVSLTGLDGQRGQLLAVAWAPVAGGLTVALTTALRRTGAAGAICGTVLLLAGVLAGYLADGAIELQTVSADNRGGAAVHIALLSADARWNIVGAAVTAAVALAALAALAGQRARGG